VAERDGSIAACAVEGRFRRGMLSRDSGVEGRHPTEAVCSLGGRIGVIIIVLHHIIAG
jgi:hypothetical protein